MNYNQQEISNDKLIFDTTPQGNILFSKQEGPGEMIFQQNISMSVLTQNIIKERIKYHFIIKQLTTQLEKYVTKKKELMQKNRELQDFIYTVTHDLKTPLQVIMGYASVLKDQPQKLDSFTDVIMEECRDMSSFITKTLSLSRSGRVIEENKVKKININKMIKKITGKYHYTNINIKLNIKNSLHHIVGDEMRIEAIFTNLVQNAVNNRTPGQDDVELEISSKKVCNNIEICIKDNGKGIKKENLSKLFDAGFSKTKGGTGFGLAIVKKIAEAHGGCIRAESDGEGKGACFCVSLPLVS